VLIEKRVVDSRSRIAEVEAYQAPGAANAPPSIILTAPEAGATFTAPASITLSATATDADGSISSVAFYANGTLIGTDAMAPYSVTWSGVAAGSYALTAVATDNAGAITTSSPVAVTANNASLTRVNVALAANGATVSASSSYGTGFAPSSAINGDRRGAPWGSGGAWVDGTRGGLQRSEDDR
jgi:hypothetical protein